MDFFILFLLEIVYKKGIGIKNPRNSGFLSQRGLKLSNYS